MPIDATIIPKTLTPVQVPEFGDLMGLIQKKREMGANQAASQAIQANTDAQGNINIPEIMKALSANPAAAYKLPEIATSLGNAQSALTQAQTANAAQAATMVQNLTPYAVKWATAGEKLSPLTIQKDVSEALGRGLIKADLAQSVIQSVPRDATPQELAEWAKGEADVMMGHQKAIESRFGTFMSDVGNGQPGFVNPYHGTVTPVTYPGAKEAPKVETSGEIEKSLVYPVRKAGDVSAMLPEEKAERDLGQEFVTKLMNRRSGIAASDRNLDEVIKTAKEIREKYKFDPGSSFGQIESKLRGTTDATLLQELKKNLANVVAANETALGGTTDAGRKLQEKSVGSGEDIVSPLVIEDIAKRAKGDNAHVRMKAEAANKFREKYGYNNYKTLQDKWDSEADSKLFQFEAMRNSEEYKRASPEEKRRQRDELLGIHNASPEDRKRILSDYNKRAARLEKLTETGTL